MAKAIPPKASARSKPRPGANSGRDSGAASPPVTISGRWLAGAFFSVLAVAALCAYATLCLLFYQGQWQMVLHPTRTITATPATLGVKFDEIHFDTTETGVPQLDGWWISADTDARWSRGAVLYLHDGTGSLSDCVNDLVALRSLGVNVFAFDYRGFGRSAGRTPNEARMTADADAAWRYLTDTRHIDGKSIVIYGVGAGASLAAELAARRAAAGVVLDGPGEAASLIIGADARARILPMGLLLTEHFDPAETLKTLTIPKLFLDRDGMKSRTNQLYQPAAFPKEYFELKPGAYDATVRRFLDEVLP